MLHLIAQNSAPLMFVSITALLLLGYPVAFTLAAGGIAFFLLGMGLGQIAPEDIHLAWSLMQAQPDRVFGILSNDTLLAVPFFTLMGAVFQRTGIAEELLESVARLFGPVRGGLCYAVVLVGALLGATTGVVSASVMTMGMIALPIMLRNGYNPHVAAGTITASGTLSQIVPPSLVLIVMADQVGQPVGEMYRAALVPAGLIIGSYMLLVLAISVLFPRMLPPLPGAGARARDFAALAGLAAIAILGGMGAHAALGGLAPGSRIVAATAVGLAVCVAAAALDRRGGLGLTTPFARATVGSLVPTLGLIFLVLGTIFLGIATPTESGAMGAVGVIALAAARGRLRPGDLRRAVEQTAMLTVFVFFILIGARIFSLTFYGLGGDEWLHRLLSSLPGDRTGFVVFAMVLIFILGCFLDFFEIAFIVVPLLMPTANAMGIDPIWFALLISINLQTSFLTPPFGFALFYLRSVAARPARGVPGLTNAAVYYGAFPFIVLNMAVIGLLIAAPGLVTPDAAVDDAAAAAVRIELPAGPTASTPEAGSPSLNDLFK